MNQNMLYNQVVYDFGIYGAKKQFCKFISTMDMKWCTKCFCIKYKYEFGKEKTGKEGLRAFCLDCLKTVNNKYYSKNKYIKWSVKKPKEISQSTEVNAPD